MRSTSASVSTAHPCTARQFTRQRAAAPHIPPPERPSSSFRPFFFGFVLSEQVELLHVDHVVLIPARAFDRELHVVRLRRHPAPRAVRFPTLRRPHSPQPLPSQRPDRPQARHRSGHLPSQDRPAPLPGSSGSTKCSDATSKVVTRFALGTVALDTDETVDFYALRRPRCLRSGIGHFQLRSGTSRAADEIARSLLVEEELASCRSIRSGKRFR